MASYKLPHHPACGSARGGSTKLSTSLPFLRKMRRTLLHQSFICKGWDSQQAHPAGCFGNFHPPHRRRTVGSLSNGLLNVRPMRPDPLPYALNDRALLSCASSPHAHGLLGPSCSSTRDFAVRVAIPLRSIAATSRGPSPSGRLFPTQSYDYAVAIGLYFCFHHSMYRGLSHHKFTPMPGIHKSLDRTASTRSDQG